MAAAFCSGRRRLKRGARQLAASPWCGPAAGQAAGRPALRPRAWAITRRPRSCSCRPPWVLRGPGLLGRGLLGFLAQASHPAAQGRRQEEGGRKACWPARGGRLDLALAGRGPWGSSGAGLSVYAYLPLARPPQPLPRTGAILRDWQQFWWVFQRQRIPRLWKRGLRKAACVRPLGRRGPGRRWRTTGLFVHRQGLRVLELSAVAPARPGLGSWACVPEPWLGPWPWAKECLGSGLLGWGQRRSRPLALCRALVLIASFAFVITFYYLQLKPEMIWILMPSSIPAYLVQAACWRPGRLCLLLAVLGWRPDAAGSSRPGLGCLACAALGAGPGALRARARPP